MGRECEERRAAITRSINFDKKDRFEIGQWFFKSLGSRLDFLRSGFTKADLSCFEKTPELSDKLTIRVIIEAMESMQRDSRL